MKTDGTHDRGEADGLDPHGDAALWDLLGRSSQPEAGPYFSRRVLREVTLGAEARPRWWQAGVFRQACRTLGRIALYASSPVAALCLLFLGLHPTGHRTPGRLPVTVEVVPADLDAIPAAAQDAAAPDASVAVNNASLPDDVSAQDVEVIADLDNLLKHEESRLWTEDTARF